MSWLIMTLMLLLAALTAGLAGCWLRLRTAALRSQARLAERARIARALHDTLLQSVQGLILSFRAHSELLPRDAGGRAQLERSLALAEQLLVEGRDEIQALRCAHSHGKLFDSLAEFGEALAAGHGFRFTARQSGALRPLRARVSHELAAIGREALFNASRHADAGSIVLLLDCGREELLLRVSDDGCGLGSCAQEPPRWGLAGMQERARLIGARLQIDSAAGQGTSITVRLAARCAYDRGEGG